MYDTEQDSVLITIILKFLCWSKTVPSKHLFFRAYVIRMFYDLMSELTLRAALSLYKHWKVSITHFR